MDGSKLQILIAMAVYMAAIVLIGVMFTKRANASSGEFFLGGRSLGPWIAALSAEASDMSGWLLMGLPGVAYWCGISDAFWTAVGLALGTYFNWLLMARRLRLYSVVADDAITVPDFFSKRFKENKKVLMTVAALFILVFFAVYAGSCFVTCGKLFSALFGMPYQLMMILGALFVIAYTFLGGFLAESASDFLQAIVMIFALVVVLGVGVAAAGGFGAVMDNVGSIPGFLDFFGIASPQVVDGVQQVTSTGTPLFNAAGSYGLLTILSTMSWGLGYFGMPQVLLRFMAIKDPIKLKQSRRIGTVWCVIALGSAVLIGLVGRALFPADAMLNTASGAENVFILLSTNLLPALLAGVVMAGILAATMSSSDSYLLIAASAFSMNIFKGVLKKDATDKQVMLVSRVVLLAVSVFGILIALDETSVIFTVVSFAWAGFGATFGPLMIFSLFWRRTNRAGALAGMLGGAATVFIWKLVLKPMGGVWGIYELLPAFVVSCLLIVVASLLTPKPEQSVLDDFDKVKHAVAQRA